MNPKLRIHAWSAAFCAVMVGLDWYDIVHYSRRLGVQQAGLAPVLFVYPLGIIVVGALAFSCARNRGAQARLAGRWLVAPSALLYALPLLYASGQSFASIEADGAIGTHYVGFGGSRSLFWVAIAALVLFQLRESIIRKHRRAD